MGHDLSAHHCGLYRSGSRHARDTSSRLLYRRFSEKTYKHYQDSQNIFADLIKRAAKVAEKNNKNN